jgi:spore maturation protein CgeB
VFEAAGAGACLITDEWRGIDEFFKPGEEILVASSAEEIVRHMRTTPEDQARRIGMAMRQRALRDHTYRLRAAQFCSLLHQLGSMENQFTGYEAVESSV